MTIGARACIFVSLLISKSMGSGNRTFDFDCGIDLSHGDGLVLGEWLSRSLSWDLFSL